MRPKPYLVEIRDFLLQKWTRQNANMLKHVSICRIIRDITHTALKCGASYCVTWLLYDETTSLFEMRIYFCIETNSTRFTIVVFNSHKLQSPVWPQVWLLRKNYKIQHSGLFDTVTNISGNISQFTSLCTLSHSNTHIFPSRCLDDIQLTGRLITGGPQRMRLQQMV